MDEMQMAQPQIERAGPENAGQHASWIAGRVETLLSHYFQPEAPAEVQEAAIDDWIGALLTFTRPAISHACETYLRDQPRRRPTPGNIIRAASAYEEARAPKRQPTAEGDRNKLSHDELMLLDEKVLPTAREWVANKPALCVQGAKTLAFWGEPISLMEAQRIRRDWLVIVPDHLTAAPREFREWLAQITNNEQPEAAE